MTECHVHGSLMMNSDGSDPFTIANPSNMIIYGNAQLIDKTASKKIRLQIGNLLTIYPGASFVASNTKITTIGGSELIINSTAVGPLTVGILNDGTIESRDLVTFMLKNSGDISLPTIFIGGKQITASLCSSVGGCGLSIATGLTLMTESLNGVLGIKVNRIDIARGCSMKLGTAGSSSGFRFRFKVEIVVEGILSDETNGVGGLILPVGSVIRILASGSLTIKASTTIKVVEENSASIIGTPFSVNGTITGPFFITVLSNGQIQTGNTGKS